MSYRKPRKVSVKRKQDRMVMSAARERKFQQNRSNEVIVLIPGYAVWTGVGRQKAAGSITLIRGEKNVLVDTGIPTQKKLIIRRLLDQQLKPSDVDVVVITHGQSDHLGNNNLFPNATFILDTDVSRREDYTVHDFTADAFHISDGIDVIQTPGHTDHDVSVVVETDEGIVVVTGDIFEKEGDWIDNSWQPWSKKIEDQRKSREKILRIADYVVPGHGDLFKAPSLATMQIGPAQERNGGAERFLHQKRIASLIVELARKFQTHWNRIDEDKVKAWLLQFGGYYDAQSALTLLQKIDYIDDERIVDVFHEFYERLNINEREIAFCTLGGPKDSSSHISYLCSKIFSERQRREIVFDNIETLSRTIGPEKTTIVFLDDVVGSGNQAVQIFKEWLSFSAGITEHVKPLPVQTAEWLKKSNLLYFCIVGFSEGIAKIESELSSIGLRIKVHAAKRISESDRCFNASSLIFDNPQVRLQARKLAFEIGYQLFADRVEWDENKRASIALGYMNAQQLIVFSYNTPNCTLPIFWKKGYYNQREWVPLFPRRD